MIGLYEWPKNIEIEKATKSQKLRKILPSNRNEIDIYQVLVDTIEYPPDVTKF